MTIFLITGASGSGKTTIARGIHNMGLWNECVSTTTRPMRKGEVEGETYYYVSKDEFERMEKNGELIESVTYDGNYYGITREEIERVEAKGRDIFIIVEYGGYLQVKAQYPDAVGIFLYMTKEDCMANMLLRGDRLDSAIKRIKTYDDELKNRDEYDYVVKNVRNKEGRTSDIIAGIIKQYDNTLKLNTGGYFDLGKLNVAPNPNSEKF